MKRLSILYLDRTKDKALQRALCKYGEVSFASDINQALFLMADCDFDYYFIDADTPQSLAFLKHLRHDPQLMEPSGVILLTNNSDEDCNAWAVDTFLNRRTAPDELPYIFSHLKADRGDPAKVLRLASFEPELRKPHEDASRPDTPVDPKVEPATLEADKDETDPRQHFKDRALPDEPKTRERKPKPAASEPGARPWISRVAIVALLLVVTGVWVVAWGPLSTKTAKKRKSANSKGVHAESPALNKTETTAPTGYAAQTTPAAAQPASVSAAQAPTDPAAADTTAGETTVEPAQDVAPEPPAPAPTPANQAPSVSISGPTQVIHGQTVSFTASATDPDGDAVSLSWTNRSMCWSTPGLYSLSVSATDSRGESSSDTISVRVI